MKNILAVLLGCSMLFSNKILAQCSDAGVCSIGQHSDSPQHSISFGYQFWKSTKTDDLTFHSVNLSADLHLFDDSRLFLGIPYNSQSGPLGSTGGPGDLTIIWTQRLLTNESEQLSVQFGGKLALAEDNAGKLPQAYQSGLGTNDLLFGLTYTYEAWSFTGAYQQPFGRSENIIDRLKRGGDLLMGVSYTHQLESFTLGGDVLFIKRLSLSSVLAAGTSPNKVFLTLPGSAQSQINIVGRASYALSAKTEVKGTFAVPMIKRSVNVDGLTRSISLSIGLSTSF